MLSKYLSEHGLNRAAFAEAVGISQPYLSQLESGRRVPSLDVAARIERVTQGVVLAVSWVSQDHSERGAA